MFTALFVVSGTAHAATFLKGFGDSKYESADAGTRTTAYDQSVEAGANIARINLSWREVATGQPANPADPADPAYDFSAPDRAVEGAASRGMRILVTVYSAPDYAEAKNQPDPDPLHPQGTFRPDPQQLGLFAEAVAKRYSGSFSRGLLDGVPVAPLPRVGYFEAWNEPNLSVFLNPQWNGRKNQAAPNYRRMMNGFYDGIKRVSPDAQVVTAGLAPFGGKLHPSDPPTRTRPLRFLREFLCLKPGRELAPKKCSQPPKFDILAHHPINVRGGPQEPAAHPDDAGGAIDFKKIAKTLRFAERKNTVAGKHGLWATEFWWQTNPPDPDFGYSLSQQARFIPETLYLLDKFGASAAIMLQVSDAPYSRENNSLQTGVFFIDGSRKPAFEAFRFPFVADRKSKGQVVVWTIPPASGELLIEQKSGSGYRTIASGAATAGEPLSDKLSLRGNVTLRASVGGDTSRSWTEGGNGKKGKSLEARSDAAAAPAAPAPPALQGPPIAVPDSLAPYLESAPAP